MIILITIIYVIISIIIIVNVHELGHLFFGKLLGYKFHSYRAGRLNWEKVNTKIKFYIKKNKGVAGACAMVPPEKEIPLRLNILFYAGGIIFNITFGILIFFITYKYITNSYLFLFLLNLGIFSIFLGLLNLIPMVSSYNPSDGKIIWSCIFKNAYAEKFILKNKLLMQLASGIRPGLLIIPIPENKVNLDNNDISFVFYNYLRALDLKDNENVQVYLKILEDNQKNTSPFMLPGIYYELCFNGCINNDLFKARQYHFLCCKELERDKDINGNRVNAYYQYYVNNDEKAALYFCEEGLKVKDQFFVKGQTLLEADLINKLKDLILNK